MFTLFRCLLFRFPVNVVKKFTKKVLELNKSINGLKIKPDLNKTSFCLMSELIKIN